MLSRLRSSSVSRRLALGLALLLPLSLNALTANTCDMQTTDASAPTVSISIHPGHGGMASAGDHCVEPVCQAVCAAPAATVSSEPPVPVQYRNEFEPVPASLPRAGHPYPLLRPPLAS